MPLSSVDKMLETMMMQLLNPDHPAANIVCCKCSKEKRRKSQTCCKCGTNSASNNKHKRRRKLKKSCLKTVIFLSKLAKDRGECQASSSEPSSGHLGEVGDERYCYKCGQLLPGMALEDHQPPTQRDLPLQHIQPIQQEYNDIGVQVNVEPQEPMSVRIKVCPCPYNNRSNNAKIKDEKLHCSVSTPELSRANQGLTDDSTFDNLVSTREPGTRVADNHFDDSRQLRPASKRLSETTPEWPIDVASVKKLALKMAKARLLEEAACREREYARRRQHKMREEPISEPPDIDPTETASANGVSMSKSRLSSPFEEEQDVAQPPGNQRQMSRATHPTYTNYSQTTDTEINNEYHGALNCMPLMQDMSGGCCTSTNVYCYSPEYEPSSFNDHCKHVCTCRNTTGVESYHGHPHQSAQQQQEMWERRQTHY